MNRFVANKNSSESYQVYIGRPSEFGNIFLIGPDGTRDEAVEKHESWLLSNPEMISKVRLKLIGKKLGCHCNTSVENCHGNTLASIANSFRLAYPL